MKYFMSILTTLALAQTALAAGGGEEGAHGPNPFEGTIYQGIAAVIVFLVVFFVLKSKAWGPILKGLQDREGKIRSDLETAERSAKDATATLEQYKKQLADAQVEAARIIEQGKGDAVKLAAQLREQTQAEITAMKNRAEHDIKSAKQAALSEIYAEAATLATQVAGRILQREINPDDQRQLVEQSLAEFGKSSRN